MMPRKPRAYLAKQLSRGESGYVADSAVVADRQGRPWLYQLAGLRDSRSALHPVLVRRSDGGELMAEVPSDFKPTVRRAILRSAYVAIDDLSIGSAAPSPTPGDAIEAALRLVFDR